MEESVKNLEQEQPCGEMENAMEQEQQAPIDFLVHCKQALRLEDRYRQLFPAGPCLYWGCSL